MKTNEAETIINDVRKVKKHGNLHPYCIIFALIIVASILSWIIPAGQYDRVLDEATGREITVAGTYHTIDADPVGPVDMLLNIFTGMVNAADIVMFIFVIGGVFGIFTATGAFEALIAKIITRFAGKANNRFVFAFLLLFFFTCASTVGMGEEVMIFTPFLVMASIALGYDAITAVATIVLGISLGYAASITNPFNIGIAQSIAGLPMYSGLWFRLIMFVVIYLVAAAYLMRYAKKIKQDPSKSLVADLDYSSVQIHDDPSKIVMTGKHKMVLSIFGITFAFMIFAVMKWAWWVDQIAAYYLVVGVLIGIANRYSFSEIASQFVEGAKTLLMAALMVAFARGIREVLTSGMILDSIIHGLTIPLDNVSTLLVGPFMVLVQSVINICIPSASAMAVVTMPIMAPLSDVLDVQRQTAVIAFQLGDGITNLIMPYYNILIMALGFASVPFQRWFKFALPLVGILLIVAVSLAGIAQFVQVGPF